MILQIFISEFFIFIIVGIMVSAFMFFYQKKENNHESSNNTAGNLLKTIAHDLFIGFYNYSGIARFRTPSLQPQTGDFLNIMFITGTSSGISIPCKIKAVEDQLITCKSILENKELKVTFSPLGNIFNYAVGTDQGTMIQNAGFQIPENEKLILSVLRADYSVKYEGQEINTLLNRQRRGRTRTISGFILGEFPDGIQLPLLIMDMGKRKDIELYVVSHEYKFCMDRKNFTLTQSYLPQYPPGTAITFYQLNGSI